MTNQNAMTVRVSPVVKAQLEAIAEKEHRTLSNLIRIIVTKWVEENGKHYSVELPEKIRLLSLKQGRR